MWSDFIYNEITIYCVGLLEVTWTLACYYFYIKDYKGNLGLYCIIRDMFAVVCDLMSSFL